MTYEAGTYVKGDNVRVAKNAKQAVALTFEGYKLKDEGDKAAAESSAPTAQPAGDEPVKDSEPTTTEAPKPSAPKPTPPTKKD